MDGDSQSESFSYVVTILSTPIGFNIRVIFHNDWFIGLKQVRLFTSEGHSTGFNWIETQYHTKHGKPGSEHTRVKCYTMATPEMVLYPW